ncbi:hypothetical protein QJS04_geneDACA000989 [Acorus gramineus]|uniref:Uncharacterized protein n=1 Tax=Acorus gramineus TaxID=55184 RepID=A0AAV9AEZ0_ACOGR|nr:hypothetical protein QJS04_geneDACA000989 [Acorus gramineus]
MDDECSASQEERQHRMKNASPPSDDEPPVPTALNQTRVAGSEAHSLLSSEPPEPPKVA